ncbi:hypothetical protein N7509_003969 [Penicillium cosmopolitanum]|uniref:MARVEL domain-containing protein n=1 Tax=Penicillium cosmopolitanum TaxID=1131564 RepID=A0A9X0BBZ8_9EURO|nr:uncharacterized protein N7509_003969 [Penicillium cosmopolitanum]KAJ5404098.1 hypothetical protein N7509_003969 [Penicillium cosmopolitanum]
MNLPWIQAVRIVQIIFGLIVVALTAYVISSFYDWWSLSDTVNYLLFLGCWTAFVATPYLGAAPIFFPRLAHRFVIPAVEIITMIFWFAGFIALGAELPPPRYCHYSTCRALQAVTVFGAFEWVLFSVTTYFAVVDLMNHRRTGESATKTQHNAHLGV